MLNNWIGAVAAAGFLLSGCAQNASKIETAEI
jgi:outer membrane murein-binding lipoprotein Lpp